MPTEAEGWFVHAVAPGEAERPTVPVRARYSLPDPRPDQVLVEPLYSCWEANIRHALERSPIDTCRTRGIDRAVIGNAAVARVLSCGADVRDLRPGQLVLPYGIENDRFGYPRRIMGFDSLLSGVLTTRLVLASDHVIPLPADTRHDAARWAAFANRHSTAWSNWRIAHGTLRLLVGEEELPRLNVWGWGGGTAFAEVQLATMLGHDGVVLTSRPERHGYARRGGVASLDRGPFANLAFDSARYSADADYRSEYVAAENAFLEAVRERTGGDGVHVFVEPIGAPVFRATLKALAREGVLTTFGWSEGMAMWYLRAQACIKRHQLIHTHFASRREVLDAIAFAEERSWLPEIDERIWSFDEVPELAASYAADRLGMFPVCRINPE